MTDQLTEWQQEFRRAFANAVEGDCPRGCGRLTIHEHDGESWACCFHCETGWRAWTNLDPEHTFAEVGEPLLTSTGTWQWHF